MPYYWEAYMPYYYLPALDWWSYCWMLSWFMTYYYDFYCAPVTTSHLPSS